MWINIRFAPPRAWLPLSERLSPSIVSRVAFLLLFVFLWQSDILPRDNRDICLFSAIPTVPAKRNFWCAWNILLSSTRLPSRYSAHINTATQIFHDRWRVKLCTFETWLFLSSRLPIGFYDNRLVDVKTCMRIRFAYHCSFPVVSQLVRAFYGCELKFSTALGNTRACKTFWGCTKFN